MADPLISRQLRRTNTNMDRTTVLWDIHNRMASVVGEGSVLAFQILTGEIPEVFVVTGPDVLFQLADDEGLCQASTSDLHEDPEYHSIRPILMIPVASNPKANFVEAPWTRVCWYCLRYKDEVIYVVADDVTGGTWNVRVFPDLGSLIFEEYLFIQTGQSISLTEASWSPLPRNS